MGLHSVVGKKVLVTTGIVGTEFVIGFMSTHLKELARLGLQALTSVDKHDAVIRSRCSIHTDGQAQTQRIQYASGLSILTPP